MKSNLYFTVTIFSSLLPLLLLAFALFLYLLFLLLCCLFLLLHFTFSFPFHSLFTHYLLSCFFLLPSLFVSFSSSSSPLFAFSLSHFSFLFFSFIDLHSFIILNTFHPPAILQFPCVSHPSPLPLPLLWFPSPPPSSFPISKYSLKLENYLALPALLACSPSLIYYFIY